MRALPPIRTFGVLAACAGTIACSEHRVEPTHAATGVGPISADAAIAIGDAAIDSGAPTELAPHLARNIIVIMGDGMGPQQIAAGRDAAGGRLRLDEMAGPALAKTDSLTTMRIGGYDPPATDSAAAATTLATGVLVENEVLSVAPDGTALETVLEVCKRAGKATGLVTTSFFFDASPAGFAAHEPSRGQFAEIIADMLTVTTPDVIMGAGGPLLDELQLDPRALAGRAGSTLLRGVAALADADPHDTTRALGLFDTDFVPLAHSPEVFTMTPEIERTKDSPDPRLATMTRWALERLAQDPDGFFLFAEDELPDEIGHRAPVEVAWASRALPAEVLAIDATVGVVLDWVLEHSSVDETLIVVLADHETGGYHFDAAAGPQSAEFRAFAFDEQGVPVGIHTRTPIEVRAIGPGSDEVSAIRDHRDTHRLLLGLPLSAH